MNEIGQFSPKNQILLLSTPKNTEQKNPQLIGLQFCDDSITTCDSQNTNFSLSKSSNIIVEGLFSFLENENDTVAPLQLINIIRKLQKDGSTPHEALSHIVRKTYGAYAFLYADDTDPHTLYAVCKSFPLYLGISPTGHFLSSSPVSLMPHANKIIPINNDAIIRVTSAEWEIMSAHSLVTETKQASVWDTETAARHGYAHYMLKEVMEQPAVLAKSFSHRLGATHINFPELTKAEIPQRIRIIACGSSYHAGLWASKLIEEIASIPTSAELASEFRYQPSLLNRNETVIFITQSGETADTLAALEKVKQFGVTTISICNVSNASIAKGTDFALYTQAGTEISIASTKAVMTQMATLFLLALYWGDKKEVLPTHIKNDYKKQLAKLPQTLDAALTTIRETAKILAPSLAKSRSMFFIGRGQNYYLSLEGALKIKELTYIHAEGYSAGEVRHGPIALVDQDFPTLALTPTDALLPMTKATINEIRTRGGAVYAITTQSGKEQVEADAYCIIPDVWEPLNGFVILPVMQLIGYELACILGNNVDQPRNLTKSVQE